MQFCGKCSKKCKSRRRVPLPGKGVQAADKGQKSSPQFAEQVDELLKSGVKVKICKVSMAGEGMTEADIFPGIEMVLGGVEVNSKIENGYSIITF
ncbi:MAG: DsrE family protein [Candidatus Thermoplasmatota archaeon]|nr:DsrE family protein [Candidatus Thermoplasmatota archaeon]